jgi:serine/threonine-protein kinase
VPDPREPELAPTFDDREGGDLEPLVPEAERYRAEGMIGRGGMGVVSAYYDRRIGRHVAWKELRRDIGDDVGNRARFLREARVQGRLEHPAIVPVYDLGLGPDGAPYFTMKTVRGTTLAAILAADQLAPHRLLAAFSRVCLAIDYAHSQGVLHRDLKPANIMFGEYGEVYVLDWGLAKIAGERDVARASIASLRAPDATSASTILGTPGYMAPEQIDVPSGVGPAADVYSLGAILFEILAREPLHERGLGALDSTRAGRESRPSARAPDRDIAPELDGVVVRATAHAPERRPSARELSEILEKFLEGERDLELRRSEAAKHADAAKQAFGSAGDVLEARRHAMKEVNRALVLDPQNSQAKTMLLELLTKPPTTVPPEVAEEIALQESRNLRWISAVGGTVYFAVLGFVAFFWWMGIRDATPIIAFTTLLIASGTMSLWQARKPTPHLVVVGMSVIASGTAFAFATRLTSPLLVIPAATAINAVGYSVFAPPRMRPLVVLVSCASFGVPLLLELAGVLAPTFAFEHGQLAILPAAIEFPATASITLVAVASIASVLIGVIIIGYIRDRLSEAERRIFLYSWQLRELLPREVRTQSDPLKFTTKRRSPLR